jgi:hypothetical protein
MHHCLQYFLQVCVHHSPTKENKEKFFANIEQNGILSDEFRIRCSCYIVRWCISNLYQTYHSSFLTTMYDFFHFYQYVDRIHRKHVWTRVPQLIQSLKLHIISTMILVSNRTITNHHSWDICKEDKKLEFQRQKKWSFTLEHPCERKVVERY